MNSRYENWEAYQQYKNRTQLRVRFLDNYRGPEGVFAPAHETDAGIDLYAAEGFSIRAGETVLIPTGVAIALPKDCEAQVRPKSGLARDYKLTVLNTPGTVDEGYRGEIKVLLHNSATLDGAVISSAAFELNHYSGSGDSMPSPTGVLTALSAALDTQTQYINAGQKIAQLVVHKLAKPDIVIVDSLDETARGSGGFGSTGI